MLALLLALLLALPCALALYHVYAWPHPVTRTTARVARVAARQHVRYVPHVYPAYNYWLQYSGTPVANLVGRTPTRTWGRYHA